MQWQQPTWDDSNARRALAEGQIDLAHVYRDLGKSAEAQASLRRAAEIYERLAAIDPRAAAPRRGIAVAFIGLGRIQNDLGLARRRREVIPTGPLALGKTS